MQKIKVFISCTILTWLFTTNTLKAQVPKDGSLRLEVTGSNLASKAYIPKGNFQFEIESDRNRNIARFMNISPDDKQAGERKTQYETAKRDFWYPVVDVEIEPAKYKNPSLISI